MRNPTLDARELRGRFAEDDRVRIDDFLAPDMADDLRTLLNDQVPFDHIYHLDGRNFVTSESQMAAKSAQAQRQLLSNLQTQASVGVGFLYGGYRFEDSPESSELGLAYDLFRYLNSADMLDFVMAMTACTGLVDADAQMTRYRSGHFLTRHRDDIAKESRKFAFVLSLTANWHPDWGGLLQFYRDDGTPRDAWMPGPNTLTLFDVRHVHAVTYVTPFATAPRLSVTGWFRGARN